jgi:hypothetical protein
LVNPNGGGQRHAAPNGETPHPNGAATRAEPGRSGVIRGSGDRNLAPRTAAEITATVPADTLHIRHASRTKGAFVGADVGVPLGRKNPATSFAFGFHFHRKASATAFYPTFAGHAAPRDSAIFGPYSTRSAAIIQLLVPGAGLLIPESDWHIPGRQKIRAAGAWSRNQNWPPLALPAAGFFPVLPPGCDIRGWLEGAPSSVLGRTLVGLPSQFYGLPCGLWFSSPSALSCAHSHFPGWRGRYLRWSFGGLPRLGFAVWATGSDFWTLIFELLILDS